VRVFFCIFLTFSCFGANVGPVGVSRVLAFEARGQEYVSHTPGYSFSVNSRAAVLSLGGRAVRMSASGASDPPSLEALHRMPGKANYILGSEFRASYDLFGSVRWRSVYPGIDLLFRGNQQRLEYDLEIGAGRDPGRIKLTFDGIDHMRIDPKGDLVMVAGAIQIRQPKPVGYQVDAAGQRQLVDVAYWIDASQRVRFRTGAYDRQRPLVIDPEIVFDQSFGGTAQNIATGFTRDAEGGLYVVGTTNSTDFPTVNPFQSQLGTGPLLVTTNAGKSWSMPALGSATSAIAIAAAPSKPSVLYVATQRGFFSSANGGTTFSVTPGAGLTSPANVLAVDAGSSTTVYAGTAQGVFVSTDGAAHWSAANIGFSGADILALVAHPTQSGTVFASTGANGLIPNALLRSTDFGQTWTQLTVVSPPNQLEAPVLAILLASNGSMILGTPSGLLISTDGGKTFTTGSNQEVFNSEDLVVSPSNPNILYLVNLAGLQQSSDGGQTFTPLLPSVNFSQFSRIAADPRNPSTLYAADSDLLYQSTNAGQTWSQLSLPYPISPQLLYVSPADSRVFLGASTQNSAFVTKWSADGSQVLYSTYLGGNEVDQPAAIAVDQSGNAYVTGSTSSPNFPTTSGAFQTKLIGATNAFVAKLNPAGSQLIYSTLLGTEAAMPAAIAVDDSGEAVITGSTQGGFPVTPGAFQSAPVDGCTLGSEYGRRVRYQNRSRRQRAGLFHLAGRHVFHLRRVPGARCQWQRLGGWVHHLTGFSRHFGRVAVSIRRRLLRWVPGELQSFWRSRLCDVSRRCGIRQRERYCSRSEGQHLPDGPERRFVSTCLFGRIPTAGERYLRPIQHWAGHIRSASECVRFETRSPGASGGGPHLLGRAGLSGRSVHCRRFRGRTLDCGRFGWSRSQRTSNCHSIPDRNRAGICQQIQRGLHAIAVFNLFQLHLRNCVGLLRFGLCCGHRRSQHNHRYTVGLRRQNRCYAPRRFAQFHFECRPNPGLFRVGGDSRWRSASNPR